MNDDLLDAFVAVAMERYDALIRNERDPFGKALLQRARPRAEAIARERIAASLFRVVAAHEQAPHPNEIN